MRKTRMAALPALFCAGAVLFAACGDFFSSTWAPDANRLANATVGSAADARFLLELAKNDPAASRKILSQVVAKAQNASSAEKTEYQRCAVQAALQGGNMGGLVLGSLGSLDPSAFADGNMDPKDIAGIFSSIAKNAQNNGAGQISRDLATLGLSSSSTALTELNNTDLTLLALTLIAGEINPNAPLAEYADLSTNPIKNASGGQNQVAELKKLFPNMSTADSSGNAYTSVDDAIAGNPSLKLIGEIVSTTGEGGNDSTGEDFWKRLLGNN